MLVQQSLGLGNSRHRLVLHAPRGFTDSEIVDIGWCHMRPAASQIGNSRHQIAQGFSLLNVGSQLHREKLYNADGSYFNEPNAGDFKPSQNNCPAGT